MPPPQPTGAGGSSGETGDEPSGETLPVVPISSLTPPAVSAEEEEVEMAIRHEVGRFRGEKPTGEFIAATLALLNIPSLALADEDVILAGEDPLFRLSLLDAAREAEAAELSSRAAVKATMAARLAERLKAKRLSGTALVPLSQGTDDEHRAKLWTDEDGCLVEVATFTQAEQNSKDSVLARRLCDEVSSRTPLGIQNVKLDPALVHSALKSMALSIRDRDYDRPSSTQLITTPREDGLLTLISLPWMTEGAKNKKFLTLIGQNAWSDASSDDGLRVMDCGKEAESPFERVRKLGYILVGVYGSFCEGMMNCLLDAISASTVNTRRSPGYVFARADGLMRDLWNLLRNYRKASASDPPLRRGGWLPRWHKMVAEVTWTDSAEDRWRKANPSVSLEPHLARKQLRIPKRKLEEHPVGTIPTTSSSAPPPKEASRRKPTPTRTGSDASQSRRPCLAAVATDLGVKKRDGTLFRCSDKCSFSHDWRTIEPWVLARYLNETAVSKVSQFRPEGEAVSRLLELTRPFTK